MATPALETLNGRREASAVAAAVSAPSWPTPEEWLETLANAGEPVPTGIPAFDVRLRGGMRPGRVCFVGGEPGAGKTALLLQIGSRMAKAGAGVAFLARDEGPESAAIRMAQHLGVPREDAERGTATAIAALARSTGGGLKLFLPDPDEIRDFRELFDVAKGWPEPRVVVLDSIQKLPLPDEPDALHEATSARVDAIRKAGRESRAIVFVASEVSRAGYARRGDRTADLASFKNSGGIEYGADVAIVLRPAEDREHEISAVIVKNRLGTKARFTLQFNPETCLYSEVSTEEVERQRTTEKAERVEELAAKIENELRAAGKLSGLQLVEKVLARKVDVYAALNAMERTGRVRSTPRGNRGFLWEVA